MLYLVLLVLTNEKWAIKSNTIPLVREKERRRERDRVGLFRNGNNQ